MGKGHRDNHKARKKRGKVAFDKKNERRKFISRCYCCHTECRPKKLVDKLCPRCRETMCLKEAV